MIKTKKSITNRDKEKQVVWNQPVPAWHAWKKDDEKFVALSKEYDGLIGLSCFSETEQTPT